MSGDSSCWQRGECGKMEVKQKSNELLEPPLLTWVDNVISFVDEIRQ